MEGLAEHGGWKILVKSAKIAPSEAVIEAVQEFAESHNAKVLEIMDAVREMLGLEMERADAAEAQLARVQAYRDTCAILRQEPSTAGLIRALRDDDDPVVRAHNHPPYDPPCNERIVRGKIVRGACLTDDGRDVQ